MSTKILIVITLCLTAAIDCKKYRYDYVYYRQIQGWLKHSKIPVTWHQARLQCQLEGAELASPLKDEILKVLKTKSHVPTWTGIHSLFSKGNYNSIEGVPILRMPISWAPGEPNNYENKEECIIILPDGTFADVRCDETFPYFCYREKFTFNMDNACGTVDHRYLYESRTGSCYKFHNHVQTWHQAFMTCAAEGAYLAITDTAVETQVLREIFSRYPARNIFGLRTYTDDALIGFQDWGEAGLWSTIHGQFFEHLMDTGVISWASGQPNNTTLNGLGQSCGGISRDGRFNDLWCHVPFAFICEKAPDSLKKGPESLEKDPDSLEKEEDDHEIDLVPAAIQLLSVDEN